MTKGWRKHHWLIAILFVCLLILIFAGSTGLASDIRIILDGILRLIGQILQDVIGLLAQLINKI